MLANIPNSQKVTVMIGVMASMLLAALDQTIVTTAMPTIVKELHGLQELSWVFTAYMLTATVTVPIYGKLSDIYGRKLFYILAIVIFLIGSILSGLSQSMTQLILFRAIQGIGGGALMANSFAILGDLFTPAERGKWQGMLGGVFGLASVVGPALGGWLTDSFTWRWNFFINIPVGIVAFALIFFLMPTITSHVKNKVIDYYGALTLSVGLVALLLGLVWGGSEYAWSSWQIIGLFMLSFISLITFGIIEQRVPEPILPLSLFKNSIFSISNFIIFFMGFGMFGALTYIPLFAQNVLGISAANTGAILTPLTFSMIISSIIGGQIMSRTGKYKTLSILGLTIMTGSMLLLSRMSAETSATTLIFYMVLMGVGLGIIMPIFTNVVQNAFDHGKLGVVTASTQLFRSLGGTVGIAVLGSVLNNTLTQKLDTLSQNPFIKTISQANPQINVQGIDVNSIQALTSSEAQAQLQKYLSQLPVGLQQSINHSYTDFVLQIKDIMATSITSIFLISTLLVGTSLIASFFLKEIPLRKSHDERPLLEDAGIEIALEGGQLPAKDQVRM